MAIRRTHVTSRLELQDCGHTVTGTRGNPVRRHERGQNSVHRIHHDIITTIAEVLLP